MSKITTDETQAVRELREGLKGLASVRSAIIQAMNVATGRRYHGGNAFVALREAEATLSVAQEALYEALQRVLDDTDAFYAE